MRKNEFVYPGSDFDRSRNLVAALGSFWADIYTGSDQIKSYAIATAQTVNQTYQNLLELVAATSRYDIPLFHTETLFPVVLKRSELNTLAATITQFDKNVDKFDETLRFDNGRDVNFYAFPLPAKMVDVVQLFNRITFPTAALVKNTDYTIDSERGTLVFAANPFDNQAFLKRPVDGDPGDEEITLWAFCGKFDYDLVFNQFAYAVGLQLKTSQGYKDLVNAIITALVEGGLTAAALDAAIAAICGIPVSVEPHEVVELVDHDAQHLLIVTDKTVYKFAGSAVPRVEPEQVIRAGTQLIQGVDIYEFFVGNTYTRAAEDQQLICCPAPNTLLATNTWEGITTEGADDILLDPNVEQCQKTRRNLMALALDSGFLSACFYGDLVFENKSVPLEVDTAHPSDYTYVRFSVGGYPADVDRFFDEVHYRGILASQAGADPCLPKKRRGTLAQLLDKRVNASTQPTAAHLPKTINPLKFLVENALRNNVFVVRIVVSALGSNQAGLYNIRQLYRLLPPQTAMIVVFELDADKDNITPESNLLEAVTTFTGMEPVRDEVPESLVRDLGATARLVSGTCQ
jgi:hypothetical protein